MPKTTPKPSETPDVTVIIPFYNEAENIKDVTGELAGALDGLDLAYDVIMVNDGSLDASLEKMTEVTARRPQFKVVNLLRNYGQAAAMMAGFDHASGKIIVPMDGDGQNDPASIPQLLTKIEEGYGVVSGWRRDRQDAAFSRKLPSWIANRLISAISGVRLHDYGCSMKAYRREIMAGVRLYGEMHRFIPIYAFWRGAKVTEIPVNHRARLKGRSKYGLNRSFKVLLDLFFIIFLERYLTRPIHVFGGLGMLLMGLAGATGLWAVWLKVAEGVSFILTPLPTMTAMFLSSSFICFLMGLLAEVLSRTYYESQGKLIYSVKNKINLD